MYRNSEEDAKKYMAQIMKTDDLSELRQWKGKRREDYIQQFRKAGITVRQIADATGLSLSTVKRADQKSRDDE